MAARLISSALLILSWDAFSDASVSSLADLADVSILLAVSSSVFADAWALLISSWAAFIDSWTTSVVA